MKHYLTKVRVLAMVLCAVLCLNTSVNVMPVSATSADVVEAIVASEDATALEASTDVVPEMAESAEIVVTEVAEAALPEMLETEAPEVVETVITEVIVTEAPEVVETVMPELVAVEEAESITLEDAASQVFVSVYANEGEVTYSTDNGQWACSSFGGYYEVGSTWAELGYTIQDPIYWDPTRGFWGWLACRHDSETWLYEPLEGATLMTSAELMEYKFTEVPTTFVAQWAGEDEDYYSYVDINGYGAPFKYYYAGNGTENIQEYETWGYSNRLKETDDGFSVQNNGLVISQEPSKDGVTFEGWLEFSYDPEDDGTDSYKLISNTIYTTQQILERPIPEYDVMYVAKWSDMEIGDYFRYNNKLFVVRGNGGDIKYTYTNSDGTVGERSSGMSTWSIGIRDTVSESLARNNYIFKGAAKANCVLDGWKVYTCEGLRWIEEEADSSVDYGTASLLYQDQVTYSGSGITYDRYLVADSYVVSTELVSTEAVNALSADKSYYIEASWSRDENQDVTSPVFEGFNVSYDADTNNIVFEFAGYDADSDYWQYTVGLRDARGNYIFPDFYHITENPFSIEYSADELPNGVYTVEFVDMYDAVGNYAADNFNAGDYTFEITNSPYVYPVVIADIIPSKDVVEVSKDKAEDVTVTVELERGTLAKDPENNNRVGYLAYYHSAYIDLYMDEQGNITGTYPVDYFVETGEEYVERVWLNIQEANEDGSIDTYYDSFKYSSEDSMGAFQVRNSATWQGEMNEGPVRVLDLSVTDKATGEEVEYNTYFDVADGKSYTLVFSVTLDEVLPEGMTLECNFQSVTNQMDYYFINFSRRADGTYQGEITINSSFDYTQYEVSHLYLHRGIYGHGCKLNADVQPYFNIKCGEQFVVPEYEITVEFYGQDGYGAGAIYANTMTVEGRQKITLAELAGGTEKYNALLAMVTRADGVACDGWDNVDFCQADTEFSFTGDGVYCFYPSYPYTDLIPVFCYYNEEGYYVEEKLEAVRYVRGDSYKDFYDKVADCRTIPLVSNQDEHDFIGWSIEISEWAEERITQYKPYYEYPIHACYDTEHYCVNRKILNAKGEYYLQGKILFPSETMTVGELLNHMEAPTAVEGYTFLRWEISEDSKCFIGGEEIDGIWTPQYANWEEDMLIVKYGCPELTAIYEEVGMTEAEAQVRAFLERMYTVALGRATDPSGVDYWTNQLLSHADDGATVSCGFILGEEFVGKNYSNEEFVTILYSTFFDRTADEGGKTYWSSILEGGATRASVLAGFVNSNEFFELCNGFGISRGVLRGDGSAINPGIYQFSERLYSEILERQGDMGGIEHWTTQLDARAITPEHAAASFFFGGEYLAKNTTNEQYIQALYRTFMGREADADGLGYWKGMLESGTDRMSVLWALAGCPEFQEIKQEYGL